MQNRRQESIRADRLERARKAVAGRIAHVCENFSPEEFDTLITRIAEIEIKYAMRDKLYSDPPRVQDASSDQENQS